MKILCNFKTLYYQSPRILEFWNKLSNGFDEANYVSVDPEIISYLSSLETNKQIILTVDNDLEEKYCNRFIEFASNFENNLSFVCVRFDELNDEYIKESVDTVLSNDIELIKRYSHTNNLVFSGNMFMCLWFSLITKGNKIVKNKYLGGLFSMLFFYFIEIFPFVLAGTMYFTFIRMDQLNASLVIPHFFSSILYCMFFKSFNELWHLPQEWKYQQQMYEPRCSNQFIECTSSVFVGTLYAVFFLAASIIYSMYNPQGSLVGLFTGITYCVSYNFSFTLRMLIALGSSVVSYLIIK